MPPSPQNRDPKVVNSLSRRVSSISGVGESRPLAIVSLLLLLASNPEMTEGWAATRVPARGIDPKALKVEQASERWENFRKQFRGVLPQAEGESGFAFLAHLQKFPRRGEVITRKGSLYGVWSDQGLLRMEFPVGEEKTISVLLRNGPKPEVWRFESGEGETRRLEGADWFAPLAPDIDYSAFDALMPFVHWENFSYVGSGRVIGRPAHLFKCVPPKEVQDVRPDLSYVRVAVDDTYDALLRVELFGKRGVVERKFSVVGFKKVPTGENHYWIVKTIDLVDLRSRDKTRLRIEAAAVEETFGPETFRKESLDRSPQIKGPYVFFD